jgi:hypothetical protein
LAIQVQGIYVKNTVDAKTGDGKNLTFFSGYVNIIAQGWEDDPLPEIPVPDDPGDPTTVVPGYVFPPEDPVTHYDTFDFILPDPPDQPHDYATWKPTPTPTAAVDISLCDIYNAHVANNARWSARLNGTEFIDYHGSQESGLKQLKVYVDVGVLDRDGYVFGIALNITTLGLRGPN